MYFTLHDHMTKRKKEAHRERKNLPECTRTMETISRFPDADDYIA